MENNNNDHAVHMTHCNMGEYEGQCKYGEDDTCPASLTSFEQKLALLHAADIYARGEVSGKHKDLYRTSRFDTDCHPEHGCGYHEEGSDAERNPSLL
jgi:hypothetical protein